MTYSNCDKEIRFIKKYDDNSHKSTPSSQNVSFFQMITSSYYPVPTAKSFKNPCRNCGQRLLSLFDINTLLILLVALVLLQQKMHWPLIHFLPVSGSAKGDLQ